MVAENLYEDEKRHCYHRAYHSPQPAPQSKVDEDGNRIQLEPAAENDRRQKLPFDNMTADKDERRHQRFADRIK